MAARRHGAPHGSGILHAMHTDELHEAPMLGYLALMVALAMMLAA